ncbi:glycosyltransferase family 8 protein [Moraxella marmotae]|uniref:glycosyltransferase family 8 protein n=1 Tax=Moraxella marmotae TaxID=3344520 RepID=UPI0035F25E14
MNRIKVVFGADFSYSEQLVVTLKSICYHNRQVDFYVLNRDFPSEWFKAIQMKLSAFDSTITDIKIDNPTIKQFKTYPHINSDATYFRYFIPQLLDFDKVLYLDCDLVVNGSLHNLFAIELGKHFVAAAIDPIMTQCHQKPDDFNAGVLLINNRLWCDEDICQKALSYTDQKGDDLQYSDQEVLNVLFKGRWLPLVNSANYQVGIDFMYAEKGMKFPNQDDFSQILPLIVHYSTTAKPWKNLFHTRLRELYWFYYSQDWSEIGGGVNQYDSQKFSSTNRRRHHFKYWTQRIGACNPKRQSSNLSSQALCDCRWRSIRRQSASNCQKIS